MLAARAGRTPVTMPAAIRTILVLLPVAGMSLVVRAIRAM
jgi:hypothetical protein